MFIVIYFIYSIGLTAGDDISPEREEVSSNEGESVTLSCSYSTTSDYIYLYWYRQHSNQAPQYLLYKDDNAPEYKERFDASLNRTAKTVPLTVQNVQLSDSAVYYCALRPTKETGSRMTYFFI
uniref:T-cell receptor alpha/delta variable 22.0 n=1 Tax=Paramormyrops kingsleyae TaxID=1676925 RepID=A0A3B3Q2D3_9TELE